MYTITSDLTKSKITGNEGAILAGWSPGLPKQAYDLILSKSAENLKSQKIFFLPYERHFASDKLLSDIKVCKDLGMIPVYLDKLPDSEDVEILDSTNIKLPVLLLSEVDKYRSQIRKIKHKLLQLLSIPKESISSYFNDLQFEIEELADQGECKEFLEIQIYILDFPGTLQRESYLAWVVLNFPKNSKAEERETAIHSD